MPMQGGDEGMTSVAVDFVAVDVALSQHDGDIHASSGQWRLLRPPASASRVSCRCERPFFSRRIGRSQFGTVAIR
uniref:Uncharacterized protein n=1 Tax=Arundo donax TaxID=35708 RepID=A0A0A8ZFD5_ARUDO